MTIDYTKSPDEILVQLINDENETTLTIADLVLDTVAIAPDPIPDRPSFNNVRTSMGVSAAVNSGYTGGVTVKYNRVHLRTVFPTTDPDTVQYVQSTDAYLPGERTKLSDLLPEINAKYNINIRPEDIFDMDLPTFSGPPPYSDMYVRLEMKAASKVFFGAVNIKLLPGDWDLANLQFTELDGLVYPAWDIPETWTEVGEQLDLMSTPGYFGS